MSTTNDAVDLYVLRVGDSEPLLHPVPLRLTHDEYMDAISPWTRFSGASADAVQFMLANPYTAARDGLSSLWIDRHGIVHVIRPHHHALTSFYALAKNCDPGFITVGKSLANSRISFLELTLASGIIRAQYRMGVGVGISIVRESPPNTSQLAAANALAATTPMEQFTAEFWEAGSHVFGNSRRLEILDHVLKFSGGNGVRASE